MSLEGIDISYAQGNTPSLTGREFVFVRAGQYNFKDSRWDQHSANVRKNGRVLGAYWFWDDRGTAADQVALFLQIAGDADLFVLDFEGSNNDYAGGREFIRLVKASGRQCGLYHSQSGFPAWGQDWNWVANWGVSAPSIPWTFHQYRGSPLDLDHFNGTLQDLQALVSAGVEPLALYESRLPGTGTWKVAAGKTAHGLKPSANGFVSADKALNSGSGHFDRHVVLLAGTGPTSLIHITDGALAGLYVSTAEVDETYDGAPSATKLAPGIYEVD